ncbi:MAG: hypothetical protein WBG42_16250 [Cryomorphaceae bacterium]
MTNKDMTNEGIKLEFVEYQGVKALTCSTKFRNPQIGDRVFAIGFHTIDVITSVGRSYEEEGFMRTKHNPHLQRHPNLILKLNDELSDDEWERIEKGAEVYLVCDEIEIREE